MGPGKADGPSAVRGLKRPGVARRTFQTATGNLQNKEVEKRASKLLVSYT